MNTQLTAEKAKKKPLLVIVTGLSGAGKSTVIHSLEDTGFYCIDNLPLALLDPALKLIAESKRAERLFALGMDARDSEFVKSFPDIIRKITSEVSIDVDVLFLGADDDALVNRFSTTRRKHPLLDVSGELLASIRRERELFKPIEKMASTCLDTTWLSPHQLARAIEQRYADNALMRSLHVTITSFGFKYGPLRNADNVHDVRFLPNPHFVAELKPHTGQNADVCEFVFSEKVTHEYFDKLVELTSFLLPHYYREGKHYLRIGIGCTGGKHRSVCIAEKLGKALSERQLPNTLVSVHHRDLDISAIKSM